MSFENPQPDFAIEIAEEAQRSLQSILLTAGIALIPHLGDAITSVIHQWHTRRAFELMGEMFAASTEQFRKIGEEKIDREWFKSDEFRALLFNTLDQLKTTHDSEKIKMLGRALAMSSSPQFVQDSRKELFLSIARYITPEHVEAMLRLRPPKPEKFPFMFTDEWKLRMQDKHDVLVRNHCWSQRGCVLVETGWDQEAPLTLLVLQPLVGHGLVTERLKMKQWKPPSTNSLFNASSPTDLQKKVNNYVRDAIEEAQTAPQHYFCLSLLGGDFLEFLGHDLHTDSSMIPTVMEMFGNDSVKASDWGK